MGILVIARGLLLNKFCDWKFEVITSEIFQTASWLYWPMRNIHFRNSIGIFLQSNLQPCFYIWLQSRSISTYHHFTKYSDRCLRMPLFLHRFVILSFNFCVIKFTFVWIHVALFMVICLFLVLYYLCLLDRLVHVLEIAVSFYLSPFVWSFGFLSIFWSSLNNSTQCFWSTCKC